MAEWTTSAAYVLAAWLGWQAMSRVRQHCQGAQADSRKVFWMMAAPMLVLLCISKFCDLSTMVSTMARQMAKTEGWYVHRRIFQIFTILGTGVIGVSVVGYMAWRQRDLSNRYVGALFGMVYLVGFVVVRAISLHQIDSFLSLNVSGFSVNWLLENAGIACVCVAAYFTARRPPRPRESVPTRPHQEVAMIRARRAHVAQLDLADSSALEMSRRQARRAAYRESLAGTVQHNDTGASPKKDSESLHAAN